MNKDSKQKEFNKIIEYLIEKKLSQHLSAWMKGKQSKLVLRLSKIEETTRILEQTFKKNN